MRLTLMHVVSVLGLPYLAGCSSATDTYVCLNSGERSFAVAVALSDATTGAKAPFYHVKAAAVDGDFTDSLVIDSLRASTMPAGGYTLQMASDRPGTYDIRVEAEGYTPWLATGVEVKVDKSDPCGHVQTRQLAAKLQPI